MSKQRPNFRLASIVAAAILLCATAHAALAHDFNVYRGVSADKKGKAQLNPGTFKFNDDLSTYDAANRAVENPAQCYYGFTITDLRNAVPVMGDSGAVMGLPGYTATFNNVPPGHWNVAAPDGTRPAVAAVAVSNYAKANRGNIVDGTTDNCH